MGDYWSIALKRFMYSGQILEFRDLGINFDTFELGYNEQLDSDNLVIVNHFSNTNLHTIYLQ